jgi:hypothetical protein
VHAFALRIYRAQSCPIAGRKNKDWEKLPFAGKTILKARGVIMSLVSTRDGKKVDFTDFTFGKVDFKSQIYTSKSRLKCRFKSKKVDFEKLIELQ